MLVFKMPRKEDCGECFLLHTCYMIGLFIILAVSFIALCFLWAFFYICVILVTNPEVNPLWDEYSSYLNTAACFWVIQLTTTLFMCNEKFFLIVACPTGLMFLLHSAVYISVTIQTVALWIQDQTQEHFNLLDKIFYVPGMIVFSLLAVYGTLLFCRTVVEVVKEEKEKVCYKCKYCDNTDDESKPYPRTRIMYHKRVPSF